MGIVNGLYVATVCALLAQPAKITEVESRAVASRRSIHSGRLDIVAILTDGEGRPVLKNEYWVEFEDDKLRFDFFVSQPPNGTGGRAGIKRKNILTVDGLISHDDPEQLGMNTAVSRVSLEDLPNGHVGVLFDPRLLGLSPSPTGMLHGHHVELFVGNPDRTNTTLGSDDLGERNTLRVEYFRTNGAHARMWIDPDRGYNVVRAELEAMRGSEKWLNRIDCDLKRYDVDGVWFPVVIDYQQFRDGILYSGEKVTVRSATFNIDVSDDRFTIATMEIPPGTPIADSAENPEGTQMWDGKGLVRMSNPDLTYGGLTESASQEEPGRQKYWIALVTANLIVILGVAFYAWWRHRKDPTLGVRGMK